MNLKLVSQVIKYWRSDAEERALAEVILYLTGLDLQTLQKLDVREVENVLIEAIRRPEEKGIQGEVNTALVKQEENEKESKGEELSQVKSQNPYLDDCDSSIDIEDYSNTELPAEPLQTEQQEEQIEIPSKLSFLEEKKAKRGRPKNE